MLGLLHRQRRLSKAVISVKILLQWELKLFWKLYCYAKETLTLTELK